MMQRLKQCVPPGVDGGQELWTIYVLWMLSAVNIFFRGPGVFVTEILRLKKAGQPAEPFFLYFWGTVWFSPVLAVLPVMVLVTLIYLAAKVIAHYRLYRGGGSRSDYTMRRLPDRREFHRRALAIPLFGLAGLALVYLAVLGIDIAIYYLMTPGWMNPRLF